MCSCTTVTTQFKSSAPLYPLPAKPFSSSTSRASHRSHILSESMCPWESHPLAWMALNHTNLPPVLNPHFMDLPQFRALCCEEDISSTIDYLVTTFDEEVAVPAL
eukprot:1913171-Rhodomonas_salina.1